MVRKVDQTIVVAITDYLSSTKFHSRKNFRISKFIADQKHLNRHQINFPMVLLLEFQSKALQHRHKVIVNHSN
jgi:hypothetical protein